MGSKDLILCVSNIMLAANLGPGKLGVTVERENAGPLQCCAGCTFVAGLPASVEGFSQPVSGQNHVLLSSADLSFHFEDDQGAKVIA